MSSMSIDGFIAGILASMRLSQIVSYPAANIDEKIVYSFNLLEQLAQRKDVEMRFHCGLNPYTKQCSTIHYGFVRAVRSGLITKGAHEFEILLSIEEAADVINASPFSLTEWKLIIKNLRTETYFESLYGLSLCLAAPGLGGVITSNPLP